ncbi:hypothetical protein OG709_16640 [Streptomyces sp. NBC_01267]|uniref:hypothetical protein n=1 Tax=Streptomyces sp. NBC_01267 TaxID=2903805 RepID=UPI002E338A0C|nr:hypothetical protein [Streptomyces sp. NBC_01267]
MKQTQTPWGTGRMMPYAVTAPDSRFTPVMSRVTPVTSHVTPVTSHVTPVMCHDQDQSSG